MVILTAVRKSLLIRSKVYAGDAGRATTVTDPNGDFFTEAV